MPSTVGSGQYILAYNNHAIAIGWDCKLIFDCAQLKCIQFIDTYILTLVFGAEYNPSTACLRKVIIPNKELFIKNTNVDFRKKEYRNNNIINKQ